MLANIAWTTKQAQQYIEEIKKFGLKFCAADIETTGIRYHPDTQICGISVAFKRSSGFFSCYYFPIAHKSLDKKKNLKKDIIIELMDVLCNQVENIVFHNAKFDAKLIQRDYGPIKGKIHDTMIDAVIQGFRKVKLSDLVAHLLPTQWPDKLVLQHTINEYRDSLKIKDYSYIPISLLGMYCCQDSANTLAVYFRLLEHFEEKGYGKDKEDLYQLELGLLRVLIDMEMVGAAIDVEYLLEQKNELVAITDSLRAELEVELGVENVNSPIQLVKALTENLNVRLTKRTKTGKQFSTDEDALKRIKHPIVKKLLLYKKKSKLLSTYVMGLLNSEYEGRSHTSYTQVFTKTGRLSSRQPNLQNIPKKDTQLIRKAFIASEERALVYFDQSQIELRFLAYWSQDARMLRAFRLGEDLHQQTADHLDISRADAKTVNFGIIYGMQEGHLANDLGISRRKAENYIKEYFNLHPGVKKFKTKIEALALSNKYVSTWLGRRVYMGNKDDYAALNYVIQGSAADLLKIMMNRCYNHIVVSRLISRMVLSVHDEVVVEMPESEFDHIIEMKRLSEDFNNFGIPIICNVALSWTNWSEAEELEI